jgi:hypothetical protein
MRESEVFEATEIILILVLNSDSDRELIVE